MPVAEIGVSTFDFARRLQDLPAAFDRFSAWGVESLELPLGELDIVVGRRILPSRLAELKRMLADQPFGVTVHGPLAATFADPRSVEAQSDLARRALEVCGEIGATAYVHHAGWTEVGMDARTVLARRSLETETLRSIGADAEAANTLFCVENIFGDAQRVFATPSELASQILAVGHPFVRATIDFSHAAINASIRGFDLMSELAALAPVAGHLHVHDSFGRPPEFLTFVRGEAVMFGFGDLHLPPTWGALDWEAIAALPYDPTARIVANLELGERFEAEIPASIAFTRALFGLSGS